MSKNDEELIEEFLLVEEFLDEVTKKMPIWMKTKEDELKDVREELESHIWDKADELANEEETNVYHIREAIALMGSPRDIAKEYRRRGTPKFFITEELWTWYYKSLIIVGVIVVFVNLITLAFTLRAGNLGPAFATFFEGLFNGAVIGFAAISLVYVQLSYHGFLPEDFKVVEIRGKEIVGIPVTTKEKPAKTIDVTISKRKKVSKPKKPKLVLESQSSYLFGGILSLAFGFTLIFFPFGNYMSYYAFDMTAFIPWIRLNGGILVAYGFIRFCQALIGNQKALQQGFLTLYLIPQGLHIALILQLIFNTAILRQPLLDAFPAVNIVMYIKLGVALIVLFTIIGMLQEISRIIQLETIGFYKRETS